MTSPTIRIRALLVAARVAESVVAMNLCLGQNGATDTVVFDTNIGHHLRFKQIAAIENNRGLKLALELIEVRASESLPFGHDSQGVCVLQRIHRTFAETNAGQRILVICKI